MDGPPCLRLSCACELRHGDLSHDLDDLSHDLDDLGDLDDEHLDDFWDPVDVKRQ